MKSDWDAWTPLIGFLVRLHLSALDRPLRWVTPALSRDLSHPGTVPGPQPARNCPGTSVTQELSRDLSQELSGLMSLRVRVSHPLNPSPNAPPTPTDNTPYPVPIMYPVIEKLWPAFKADPAVARGSSATRYTLRDLPSIVPPPGGRGGDRAPSSAATMAAPVVSGISGERVKASQVEQERGNIALRAHAQRVYTGVAHSHIKSCGDSGRVNPPIERQ
ncbi:unnamed protein product [Lota lota]